MATGPPAAKLDATSLDEAERRTVKRFARLLEEDFGDQLISLWLYGSRARRERPTPESDVDLLVVSRMGRRGHWSRAFDLMSRAAEAEGLSPAFFSVKVFDQDWIDDRRRIGSFFIQEVDRDKVVVVGEP